MEAARPRLQTGPVDGDELRAVHGRSMLAALRLGDHELAADELERLTIEDAGVNSR